MLENKKHFIHRLHNLCLAAVAMLCVNIVVGCGDDDGNNSEPKVVGSAEVSWSLECPEDETLSFIAQAYDSSNTYLTYGGPWDCSLGKGTIGGISVGSERKIVLFGEDGDGGFRYRGEKRNIDIQENMTTDVGGVETHDFVASLEEPEDEASVTGSLFLEWNYVSGAARYFIMISDNIDFLDPIIQATVNGPPYMPEGLDAGVRYYWKVMCMDIYDNESADSEIWQFTISGPAVTITNPVDGESFDEFSEIFFLGEAVDDGSLSGDALVWSSDVDGQFGIGEYYEYFGLSIGTHIITLTATSSSSGYTGSDSITIHILPVE